MKAADLDKLCQSLKSDPTNLSLADPYWNALGSDKGHNIRNGHHLIEAYRQAALTSLEGVEAFAKAYKELFESSGEGPRPFLFDKDLMNALESYLKRQGQNGTDNVGWILESLGRH